jgi:hypothetical protein
MLLPSDLGVASATKTVIRRVAIVPPSFPDGGVVGFRNSRDLADYSAGVELAIKRGWLELHEGGTVGEASPLGYY